MLMFPEKIHNYLSNTNLDLVYGSYSIFNILTASVCATMLVFKFTCQLEYCQKLKVSK